MATTAQRRCECGSGLPFGRCHGDPRNGYAREQALREAEGVPFMFPFVRARSAGLDFVAERGALELRGGGDIPDDVVDAGLAALDGTERRRVVDLWAIPYRDRWESIVHASGDASAAEAALVTGAVCVAVAERRPPPPGMLEPLEDERLHRSPLAALATVLVPAFVWSLPEAEAAQVAAATRRARDRFEAVEHVGYALVTYAHMGRTRALARRLVAALPAPDAPKASRLLRDVCRDVERDVDAARTATVALLIAYVEQRTAVARGGAS